MRWQWTVRGQWVVPEHWNQRGQRIMHGWWTRAACTAIALAGVLELVTMATPQAPDERGTIGRFTGALTSGGLARAGATGLGLAVLVLAAGLLGRRTLAQQLAIAVLALSLLAAGHTSTQQPRRMALLAVGAAVLWALRGEFPVRPEPHQRRRAMSLTGAVAASAGWWLLAGGSSTGWQQLTEDASAVRVTAEAAGVLVITGIGVVAMAWAFLPATAPAAAPPALRASVAALVDHPDSDSLAPFCTRADRSYAFSDDGRAAVGYRVLLGTAVVGGDPVGATDAFPDALRCFLDTCRRQGWHPAVLGASAGLIDQWRAAGVRRGLVIGDEAIVDLATFTLSSRRMRNVRQAVARTRNAGVQVTIGPLDETTAATLRPVLDDWLRQRPERGFAMNLDRILVPHPGCVVAVARDRDGRPQAFARFASAAGGRILTLDVAPRRACAPNGVVERLFAEMVAYGRDRGAEQLSLNFAGMRHVLVADGRLARGAATALRLLDRWIQLAPLYRFVAKFQPDWQPRWLLLRSWAELGPVAAAALTAEFGTSRPQAPRQAAQAATGAQHGDVADGHPLAGTACSATGPYEPDPMESSPTA